MRALVSPDVVAPMHLPRGLAARVPRINEPVRRSSTIGEWARAAAALRPDAAGAGTACLAARGVSIGALVCRPYITTGPTNGEHGERSAHMPAHCCVDNHHSIIRFQGETDSSRLLTCDRPVDIVAAWAGMCAVRHRVEAQCRHQDFEDERILLGGDGRHAWSAALLLCRPCWAGSVPRPRARTIRTGGNHQIDWTRTLSGSLIR
eukprot:SAG31_NODE_173_length_21354_cov_16.826112_18_plen_205_part_00